MTKYTGRWKGVVFDFDGTLLNSHLTGRERFVRIAATLGLPVSEKTAENIKKMWGTPGYILVEACWPGTCTETFMYHWEKFDSENPLQLFAGAREAVETLSASLLLSLLTSRDWSTHAQLREHGIDSLFTFVCTLEDSPVPKPHPRSIDPLLRSYHERHGVAPNDLVLVGDSVHSDYGLAQAIGMDFIAASWGNNTRDEFLAAGVKTEYIADSIEHLLQMFIL
ncbi:MAG: HAD family hydrolase [bacterium]|nr:HAD family hydrolase [bacterium]MDZ4286126.1 HAD family hydrolase [Candidatus Sungbacteria bacterium]